MKRFPGIFPCIAIVVTFIACISMAFSAQAPENRAQVSGDVPEKLVYEIYFRRIAYFQNLADRKNLADLSRIRMKAAVKEELAINDEQNDILSQVGRQALAEAALLDAQAKGDHKP